MELLLRNMAVKKSIRKQDPEANTRLRMDENAEWRKLHCEGLYCVCRSSSKVHILYDRKIEIILFKVVTIFQFSQF